MEKTENDFKAVSEGFSEDKYYLSFFSPDAIDNLLRKLNSKEYIDGVERNNLLLLLITLKQPISKYELAKISGLSYATIKQVCKWAKANEFIKTKISLGDNGMPVQLVFIHGKDRKDLSEGELMQWAKEELDKSEKEDENEQEI